MRQEKGKMIQPTTSFMFVENVKQVVKHALMILLALHLIIGHLGNLILILHIHYTVVLILVGINAFLALF